MTTDKLKSVFTFYLDWCVGRGHRPKRDDEGQGTALQHVAWMCQTAVDNLVPSGRIDKAMRWLGFVQGVLVTRGYFTLEDVKRHSTSATDNFDAGRV